MPANPNTLLSTDWVAHRLHGPNVVVAEVDEDATAYELSHIPGAVGFDWTAEFQNPCGEAS